MAYLNDLTFSQTDLDYLASLGYNGAFLEYLRDFKIQLTVRSAKEGDFYTYAVWDLTEFNNRYGTKYYARAYKRFDESTDTTVELIDKTLGMW